MDAQQLQQLLTTITTGLTCPAAGAFCPCSRTSQPNECPRLHHVKWNQDLAWSNCPTHIQVQCWGKGSKHFLWGTCTTSTTVRMDTYLSQHHNDWWLKHPCSSSKHHYRVQPTYHQWHHHLCDTLDWKQHSSSSEQLPDVHRHHGFTYQRWLHQDSCWAKQVPYQTTSMHQP